MIKRVLQQKITQEIGRGKVIILLGPRQVGKTTLVETILDDLSVEYTYYSGDDPTVDGLFRDKGREELRELARGNRIVFVDEAQRIRDIGLRLKLLVDNYPDIQFIVTGSSSLDLARGVNEPLTGRKYQHYLYPISYAEYAGEVGRSIARQNLPDRLVYGFYPEVILAEGAGRSTLQLIAESYLYKDILALEDIRKPDLLTNLLQALALQVGSEVSYNELAKLLRVDAQTVERYVALLEQAFVIFRLRALARNPRKEISRGRKVYFWDNGIRNALLNNFEPMTRRTDRGALWENFIVSERLKAQQYHDRYGSSYFWRNYDQAEVDYVEVYDGRHLAYKIKWNPRRKGQVPRAFLNAYERSEGKVITPSNFEAFLLVQGATKEELPE
ncbi:ATP-binding protein [Neolewinella sp.]|uniref:ATP-binding protein n=1 Tax=Neolewinella sp. TaxID=2993543 RepID=UPI003B516F4E